MQLVLFSSAAGRVHTCIMYAPRATTTIQPAICSRVSRPLVTSLFVDLRARYLCSREEHDGYRQKFLDLHL